MPTKDNFSPEVRDRAVRMVEEHRADIRLGMGGDQFNCRQDRLHGTDATPLPPCGGEPTNGAGDASRQ